MQTYLLATIHASFVYNLQIAQKHETAIMGTT
jgi:hypothetical protein